MMAKVSASQADSVSHAELLRAEGIEPSEPAQVDRAEAEEIAARSGAADYEAAVRSAMRPAAMAEPVTPPGLSLQGASPEVVARHPQLMSETMAELAGAMAAADEEPIDPTDEGALRRAQRTLASADFVATELRNTAAALNATRLAEAIGALNYASGAVQAAVEGAVADVKAAAEARKTEPTS
jgi:hypothetical protein